MNPAIIIFWILVVLQHYNLVVLPWYVLPGWIVLSILWAFADTPVRNRIKSFHKKKIEE